MTIKQTIMIPGATPLEVFRAFTRSTIHSEVTGSPAVVNARIGGKFSAWDGYISGRNVKLVRGKRIVQEWRTTEWPNESIPSSLLDITLYKRNKGTELKMVHSRIPSKTLARRYEEGWHTSYWNPMMQYFNEKKAMS